MEHPGGLREDELAEAWMAARQRARRRPTPEHETAAEAAFARYREFIIRRASSTTAALVQST